MELSLSGNALRTLHRSITSLARIGTDLVLQCSASRLALHTLNTSRSAYHSITFTPDFFDSFSLLSTSSPEIHSTLLLKSVCSVFRTPVAALDRLSLLLSAPDAPKIQFILHCLNGAKKTYWITALAKPNVHHLSLDRSRFPSNLVVRPRDLSRLLSNFRHSLHEITVIATEPSAAPDLAPDIGGKAVELRSYKELTKDDSDAALHTQLWIDPAEEFAQYVHSGNPVDVTFGVKELKAFEKMSFSSTGKMIHLLQRCIFSCTSSVLIKWRIQGIFQKHKRVKAGRLFLLSVFFSYVGVKPAFTRAKDKGPQKRRLQSVRARRSSNPSPVCRLVGRRNSLMGSKQQYILVCCRETILGRQISWKRLRIDGQLEKQNTLKNREMNIDSNVLSNICQCTTCLFRMPRSMA